MNFSLQYFVQLCVLLIAWLFIITFNKFSFQINIVFTQFVIKVKVLH